jgi:hypothetical protein
MNSTRVSKFDGRRALKYLGVYRPQETLPLGKDYVLIPQYGRMEDRREVGRIRLNTSHFVSIEPRDDADIVAAYRNWLIFDSLILGDSWPTRSFDSGLAWVTVGEPQPDPDTDSTYQVLDYSDIGSTVYFPIGPDTPQPPRLDYVQLYERYLKLDPDTKDQVEWLASASGFKQPLHLNSLFRPNYWQVLHLTFLLDDFFGSPPSCDEVGKSPCPMCNRQVQRHHSVSSRDWRRTKLSERVSDAILAESYLTYIEAAFSIRHKSAHGPHFDRSVLVMGPTGVALEYDAAVAIGSYKQDSAAIEAILLALSAICRMLVLDRAFGTRYFRDVPVLKTIVIGAAQE